MFVLEARSERIAVFDLTTLMAATRVEHFGVGQEFELHRERPGLGVGLGIVNSDFDIQVTKVTTAEGFNRMKSLGMRKAVVIEPASEAIARIRARRFEVSQCLECGVSRWIQIGRAADQ